MKAPKSKNPAKNANAPEAAGSVPGHNSAEVSPTIMLSPADDVKAMVKSDVEALTLKAKELLDMFGRVPKEIENDEVYNRVLGLAAQFRSLTAKREKDKKAHKDPYNKASTAIENEFKLVDGDKPLIKEIDKGLVTLTKLASAYDTKKFLEEEAQAEKEREEIAAELKKDGVEIDSIPAADTKLASTKSEHGGQGIKKVETQWEVIDETLVPRSLLSIDPAKVQALIDQGAKEIPGLKLSKVVSTIIKR